MATDTFTIEEIQEMAFNVQGPTYINKDDPEMLDDKKCVSLNLLLQTGVLGRTVPTLNKVAAICEARRRQRIQFWAGADLLSFQAHAGSFELKFPVGQGHMGDEILFDFLRHQGVRVNYKSGINGGHDKGATSNLFNFLKRNNIRLKRAFRRDLCKSLWRINAGEAKAFLSLIDLFSPTSNSTGTIGEKSRSNPLLRHQLKTGVDVDTIMLDIRKVARAMSDASMDGEADLIFAGDNMFDILAELFSGTSTQVGKIDYRAMQEAALKKGEQYNIALPQDCFAWQDRLFIREPLWNEIDEEDNPTVKMADMLIMLNTEHVGFEQIRDGEGADDIKHPVPYNQRLQRRSLHGEWASWSDRPGGACGILVKS